MLVLGINTIPQKARHQYRDQIRPDQPPWSKDQGNPTLMPRLQAPLFPCPSHYHHKFTGAPLHTQTQRSGKTEENRSEWGIHRKETVIQKDQSGGRKKKKHMTYYKLAKLGWREISSTLENFKSYIFFARLGDKECATEQQRHPSERNPQPFWAVRWTTLPHVSFPKANGTYHETFHSISSATNFLPDMKKCTASDAVRLSLPSEYPSSAFNHTQN